ncbi:hypothetical protein [Tianweitania sediminis]|jgi:hypothetical protein|uniref:Uncharacterized protein n=1 Tax=Tianweitania sediminis TaxID=1502156 RepID=A0A8J7R9G4_9HYPH|nr:hypothetical protein [Tianweitania sediminis]MBP0440757.1 hypothetical protein [Tianweitania sediminis]HEV7417447.1 hypothetical protein [Tianweitania sediminis]
MKLISRIFANRRHRNMVTVMERERFNRTMPGQTAAMVGARLGFLV